MFLKVLLLTELFSSDVSLQELGKDVLIIQVFILKTLSILE